jgi:hypothetical protein
LGDEERERVKKNACENFSYLESEIYEMASIGVARWYIFKRKILTRVILEGLGMEKGLYILCMAI